MHGDDWPLIAVAGPTASGKSVLALDLAERFHGEIVNCDSVQLYRFMDIGAAKTPESERRGIPHHLIDVLDPDQHFTAGDYGRLARRVVAAVASRGRVPVVVGGTGFYLRALLQGLFEGPARDEGLRDRLARRRPGSLHRLLTRFDPASAARIHPNDRNKLIRALEVCLLTRRPMTEMFEERASHPLRGFRVIKIGLDPPPAALAARIDQRCRLMFEAGLVEEAQRILALGFSPDSKALLSIGYREAILHLQGFLTRDEAVERARMATRQYAKRQRTWFRREQEMFWIRGFGGDVSSLSDAVRHLTVGLNFSLQPDKNQANKTLPRT